MSTTDWTQRLKGVRSSEDVVWIAQEYLATWSPERIEGLAPNCRPARMSDADDVSLFAFTLVQEQCRAGVHSAELQAMANFFAAAASRISQILAHAKRETTSRQHFTGNLTSSD
jgi:hypothetical protein